MTEKSSGKLWSKEFIFLLTINIINSIAFGTINPIFPGFIVSLGGTLTVAGLITGLFAYAALAGRPLASILGNRATKKDADSFYAGTWIVFRIVCLCAKCHLVGPTFCRENYRLEGNLFCGSDEFYSCLCLGGSRIC